MYSPEEKVKEPTPHDRVTVTDHQDERLFREIEIEESSGGILPAPGLC